MKRLITIVSLATAAVFAGALAPQVRATPQPWTQGPEYVWRAQCDFVWQNTLTPTPGIVKFPITAFFGYDLSNGITTTQVPSGPPTLPDHFTVDLIANAAKTVTIGTGQSAVTLTYAQVAAAFQALIAQERAAETPLSMVRLPDIQPLQK